MYPIQKILGDNLRYFRTKQNLSQKTLAERCELSNNYIGLIERGIRWPSAANLEVLAQAMQIDSCQLFIPHPELYKNPQLYLQQYARDLLEAQEKVLKKLPPKPPGGKEKTDP